MILQGKRILVTGASRGLGRALVREFVRQGAQVAFTYGRDDAGAQETLALAAAAGREALARKVSVLDGPGTEALVADLERAWGGLDVLVNNAGITQALPLALLEEEDWDRVMDVNVKGTFLTSRAVVKGMIRRKAGVILNLGSLAGVRMIEAPVHYYTSKAAIKGFTEALAKEVARYRIRVLCLAPGLLDDGVGRNLPEHRLKDYLAHDALGRVGTVEEVARLAAFLVSDRNAYMNGETVVVDGGL
ncbi:MAG: SDR family oxidoreductase [Planctomycetes bacterium]|nr:SDR family oxidoreductase [Planctomycetota bacterium]